MRFSLISIPRFSYRARWEFAESPTLETTLQDLYSNQNNFLGELLNKIDYHSLLEVGSGCGSRLIRLAQEHPERKYSGIDLSHKAILSGKQYAVYLGLENLVFAQANLTSTELPQSDLIFSWATLMYVHPLKIGSVVKKILGYDFKTIILIEPRSEKSFLMTTLLALFSGTGYSYNFEELINKFDKNLDYQSQIISQVPKDIWKPGMGPGYIYIFTRRN